MRICQSKAIWNYTVIIYVEETTLCMSRGVKHEGKMLISLEKYKSISMTQNHHIICLCQFIASLFLGFQITITADQNDFQALGM